MSREELEKLIFGLNDANMNKLLNDLNRLINLPYKYDKMTFKNKDTWFKIHFNGDEYFKSLPSVYQGFSVN